MSRLSLERLAPQGYRAAVPHGPGRRPRAPRDERGARVGPGCRADCIWEDCQRTAPARSGCTAATGTPGVRGRRHSRDAPLMIVGERTNEIQRNVIAVQLVAREKNGSI